MTLTLQHLLLLSAALFAIGAAGACVRRNVLVVFMSIQTMMAAAMLAMASFARWNLLPEGKAAMFFLIAVLAAQAAAGLALLVAVFKRCGTVHGDELRLLRD
ncbi:MAG: NADH-quinone oxidoreductase subunit NuoK [Proteobacteria bacterium]|nr:NADH-quinone oxidoreductase subunit NuoK [Pseudomonadota bacterium]